MEKKKPHYSLVAIQATFSVVAALRITKTATRCVEQLGLRLQDVVEIIQAMRRDQFYKSMTSEGSSAIWQDVYHVPHRGSILYVKFTVDAGGYLVVSLKER